MMRKYAAGRLGGNDAGRPRASHGAAPLSLTFVQELRCFVRAAQFYRDSRTGTITEGTSSMQLQTIAKNPDEARRLAGGSRIVRSPAGRVPPGFPLLQRP